MLNSGLWNSGNEILPRSEERDTALIPELYLQSGWNGMRRKEAEVGAREGGTREEDALISLDLSAKRAEIKGTDTL